MALGAELIATGHYARVRENAGQFELLKAIDASKDQSYFLHRLNQSQLSHTLFPLGELHKTEIRKIADELGLPNARKKDSTGICFIGERPFREFLHRYLSFKPGPMMTPDGEIMGEHIGLSFYTLGQRKGIGLGGSKNIAMTTATMKPGMWRVKMLQAIRCMWCRAMIIPGCYRSRWQLIK